MPDQFSQWQQQNANNPFRTARGGSAYQQSSWPRQQPQQRQGGSQYQQSAWPRQQQSPAPQRQTTTYGGTLNTRTRYDEDGNEYSTVNAGPRRMDNSAVNYGGVAAIGNYLQTINPAQRQQASNWLSAQGLMPTYNGTSIGNLMNAGGAGGANNLGSQGGAMYSNPSGVTWSNGLPAQAYDNPFLTPTGMVQHDAMGRAMDSTGMELPGYGGAGGTGGSAPGGSGWGGQGGMGGPGGYGGPTFPLEGAMQDQIMGVLNNPSPYSAEQTNMLRNRATTGVEQAGQISANRARDDAIRRGVSPQEAAGDASAQNARYDALRMRTLNDFDLGNAQATRQGLMQGLGAGQGLLGAQMSNEDSIRRYLAMLGSNAAGQQPMFLNML